ncbi:unnamed protein product [Diabrotica balteata]|uniref:Uncharacterized protein n=1 Tax=Diabrotica balteata TaxID=107213 RepID=A0A9N9XI16_DIABA|nr:unnamed protein product [Diabrotica balteata]
MSKCKYFYNLKTLKFKSKDIQSSKLLHFQFLKEYHDKTSATVDTNYFSTIKTNKTTLAFIVNHLNTNNNEIHVESFGIHTGSLEMQLIDLKSKALWRGNLLNWRGIEKQVGRVGSPEMYVRNAKKWSDLKEMP